MTSALWSYETSQSNIIHSTASHIGRINIYSLWQQPIGALLESFPVYNYYKFLGKRHWQARQATVIGGNV